MPNWVYQTLTVEGDAKQVAAFVEKAKCEAQALDFNQFIKMPDELRNTEQVYYADPEQKAKQEEIYAANKSKYGYASWYDWACSNWNTKWNAADVELEMQDNDTVAFYQFQTAWDAPIPVFHVMSQMFPSLTFTVTADEESQEFYYEKVFASGGEISHTDLEREEG